jgi:short-subunit dehydrogenase involved in D-alanine esterification of teichoic acids
MPAAHPKGGVWRDRVVLVTGGNSGIGRAFVERLAAGGAKVIVCGRNEMTLQELQNQNPGIVAFRCDITVRQDVLALANGIQNRVASLMY